MTRPAAMAPPAPPARIVVGYDGSPGSEAALRWAASLAAALGSAVRVVHAVGLLEHARLAPVAAHEQQARAVATGAGLDPARFEWCVVDGDPGSVLRRAAEGADGGNLLVVGTRGAGAHAGTLLGSTSLGLAEEAPVPVVVVPTPSPPDGASPPGEVMPRRAPGESPPA